MMMDIIKGCFMKIMSIAYLILALNHTHHFRHNYTVNEIINKFTILLLKLSYQCEQTLYLVYPPHPPQEGKGHSFSPCRLMVMIMTDVFT